ncbi:MAG TPA: cob(I)yrinic acid a,c-diamide adenosyltransferase [Geothermobacteraceae bacterium]|nr:cob(I)yrinic acid a,c-diamide adenosyltransferase [Geothermobacteraceae bacterium]
MVKLDRITTGGGDKGRTSLANGERVAKHSLRVNAYGSVDELNSLLGVVATEALPDAVAEEIGRIQNDLFDLGSDLAAPPLDGKAIKVPRIGTHHVERLEGALAAVTDQLQPAPSFVLPGGSKGAAYLHLARSVTRRVEREVWALAEAEPAAGQVNPYCLTYLNRLSDLCFVWARLCNDSGRSDRLWKPCENC